MTITDEARIKAFLPGDFYSMHPRAQAHYYRLAEEQAATIGTEEHTIDVALTVAELDVLKGVTFGLGQSPDPMDRRGAALYERFDAADRALDVKLATEEES
jgi:hypothetical protein